jgi:hypothetical protein
MAGWQYGRMTVWQREFTLEIRNSVIIVICGMPLSRLIWIRLHFQQVETALLVGSISAVYWGH